MCGSDRRIVVGVDDTDASVSALAWAGAEARIRHGHLHVVNALAADGTGVAMDDLLQRALPHRPDFRIESVSAASRAPELLIAASHGADLLVVGTRNRSGFTAALSSVSARTVAFATCPVAVVKDGQEARLPVRERVVVGIDDSYTARDALRWAAHEVLHRRTAVSQEGGCELHIVHVIPPEEAHNPPEFLLGSPRRVPDRAAEIRLLDYLTSEVFVDELAAITPSVEVRAIEPHDRTPAVASYLVDAAAESDLLVVGARGFGVNSDALHPSITHGSLLGADCPVVITPATREDQRNRIVDATRALEHQWTLGGGATVWEPVSHRSSAGARGRVSTPRAE